MRFFWIALFFLETVFAISDIDRLIQDLQLVKKIDTEVYETLPTNYGYNLVTGYFNMPSARMPQVGMGSMQYAHLPPYDVWSLGFQFFQRLEISGSYYIFLGVPDPGLMNGFGDYSDRTANFKIALLLPEDSNYYLPGVAFGMLDFFGSKNFSAQYIVATQVIRSLNLELTLGYGKDRIKGIFGGLAYYPFRKTNISLLKGLMLATEYDHNDYENPEHEPSPFGRSVKSRINVGFHYSLFDLFTFSLSSVRGEKVAFAFNLHYNLGQSKGLFEKVFDTPAYSGPTNLEGLGKKRPYKDFIQEVTFAFQSQGLTIYKIQEQKTDDKTIFWLRVANRKYRKFDAVKERINRTLANLVPSNIDRVVVQVENDTIPVYQITYKTRYLIAFEEQKMGPEELNILSPRENIKYPKKSHTLFKQNKSLLEITARPRLRVFWGSAAGKIKYDLGVLIGPSGYIANSLYYKVLIGVNVADDLKNLRDYDKFNPSQIINVRSDSIDYYREDPVYIDKMYLQKNFSFGGGFFARLAVGYFEIAYAGIATEFLYFPAKYNFAIGVEGAVLKKRAYSGLKFQQKIRKLVGITPTYEDYTGVQYFLNLYYDVKKFKIQTHVQIGQFLARDLGIKATLSRYFDSGLCVSFWIGTSNKKDIVNGKRYYEKGVSISFPLDLVLPLSSKHRFQAGGSEWLRDVVQTAQTGKPLYNILHSERRDY